MDDDDNDDGDDSGDSDDDDDGFDSDANTLLPPSEHNLKSDKDGPHGAVGNGESKGSKGRRYIIPSKLEYAKTKEQIGKAVRSRVILVTLVEGLIGR